MTIRNPRSEGAPRSGFHDPSPQTAPEVRGRATETQSTAGLLGRSILLLHDDRFVSSYISAVLLRAGARIVESESAGESWDLLSARTSIDAAILNFDLSSADSHALADELARQALPHLFVRAGTSCNRTTVLRGRLCLTWPFAGFQVREALAGIMTASDPGPARLR